MQHGQEQDRDRLAEVDVGANLRRAHDLIGPTQVSLQDADRVRPRDQRLAVRHHDWIVVDVDHPCLRAHALGDLVDVAAGRQAGADVEELPYAFAHEKAHGPAEKRAVAPRRRGHARRQRDDFLRRFPVGGEIVLAAKKIVIHTGALWNGRVHAAGLLVRRLHSDSPGGASVYSDRGPVGHRRGGHPLRWRGRPIALAWAPHCAGVGAPLRWRGRPIALAVGARHCLDRISVLLCVSWRDVPAAVVRRRLEDRCAGTILSSTIRPLGLGLPAGHPRCSSAARSPGPSTRPAFAASPSTKSTRAQSSIRSPRPHACHSAGRSTHIEAAAIHVSIASPGTPTPTWISMPGWTSTRRSSSRSTRPSLPARNSPRGDGGLSTWRWGPTWTAISGPRAGTG